MKAAPEGVAVSELEPESEKMMAHYRAHVTEYGVIADGLHVPKFSNMCKDDLFALLCDNGAVALIEAVARLKKYADHKDHASMRKAVSRLLRKDGIKLPRGKRTQPGMLKLVADLTPIFLHYGLPCASSERSRLVRALRIVAEEIEIEGDPRDELRRLSKINQRAAKCAKEVVYSAAARGLSSDIYPK